MSIGGALNGISWAWRVNGHAAIVPNGGAPTRTRFKPSQSSCLTLLEVGMIEGLPQDK